VLANTKVCTLSHQQFDQAKNQRLLAIELSSQTGEDASGTIALPFGLELSAGITLSVEEKPAQTKMAFKTCFAVGCLVPVNWEKTFIARLKANKTLQISAVASDTQQPVNFTISLRGFSSAISRAAELAKN
jgi:invasion protein IalB